MNDHVTLPLQQFLQYNDVCGKFYTFNEWYCASLPKDGTETSFLGVTYFSLLSVCVTRGAKLRALQKGGLGERSSSPTGSVAETGLPMILAHIQQNISFQNECLKAE